jgi:glucokinase
VGAFAAEDTRRLCPCGRDDCLEACFGAEALFERVRERGADLGDFADDVLAAAKAGHTQAVEVFREAGRVIGNAVAIACDVINPSVLVLGGSLSSVEPLTNALKAAVFERVSILSSRRLRVEPSVAGAKAGISGASALILDHVLSPGRIDSLLQNGANGREPTTVTPAG